MGDNRNERELNTRAPTHLAPRRTHFLRRQRDYGVRGERCRHSVRTCAHTVCLFGGASWLVRGNHWRRLLHLRLQASPHAPACARQLTTPTVFTQTNNKQQQTSNKQTRTQFPAYQGQAPLRSIPCIPFTALRTRILSCKNRYSPRRLLRGGVNRRLLPQRCRRSAALPTGGTAT